MRISDWSSDVCSSDLRRCRDSVGSAPRRPGCAHSSSWLVVLDGLSKPGPCRVRRLLRHDGEVMLGGFGFPVLLNLSAGLDIAVVGVFPWDRRDPVGSASCRESVCKYV